LNDCCVLHASYLLGPRLSRPQRARSASNNLRGFSLQRLRFERQFLRKRLFAPAALVAGGTRAVPVQSLSSKAHEATSQKEKAPD